jgi:hypothetical protein
MFFWVFPRRHILICRRFGTYYQFHLQRLDVEYPHSANQNMTPGKYPIEHIQYSEHGESLKSRIHNSVWSGHFDTSPQAPKTPAAPLRVSGQGCGMKYRGLFGVSPLSLHVHLGRHREYKCGCVKKELTTGFSNEMALLVSACLRALRLAARGSTLYSPATSCLTAVGIYTVSTQLAGSGICSEEKFPTSEVIIHIHCALAI